MRILVIDNHDSFVYNLVQYLHQLGAECEVRRNDELSVTETARRAGAGVLLSPGPGGPDRAGICAPLISALAGTVPILGVCLGHQTIGAVYGATVARAPELLHGMTSAVSHSGAGVLAGLPDPFTATRYHSLALVESTLPPELEVTARTTALPASIMEFPGVSSGVSSPQAHDRGEGQADRGEGQADRREGRGDRREGRGAGVVMAIRHRTLPIEGVQFHPEAVLSQAGHLLLANWLAACGLPEARDRAPALAAEVEAHRLAAFSR